MFKSEDHRRSSSPIIVLFRLILSLSMFAVLLVGVYSAYKHFSGLDPLKIDLQAVLKSAFWAKAPQELLGVLSSVKQHQDKIVPGLENKHQDIAFRFLLIADSHNDSANLQKAIAQAKLKFPDLAFIIGLGDYTIVGTIDELKSAKSQFDLAGFRYFLVPGDHDLWDSRDKKREAVANFKEVFGPNFQSFNYEGYIFLLLDNSDNYLGFSQGQLDWINTELEKGKNEGVKGIFAFIPSPLYHPSSDRYMGKSEASLKQQAQAMILQLKSAGVKKVFAGDIHYFSEYEEPITKLSMTTVGAIATERNPQAPRYAVVTVYEDGSSRVEDIEIK